MTPTGYNAIGFQRASTGYRSIEASSYDENVYCLNFKQSSNISLQPSKLNLAVPKNKPCREVRIVYRLVVITRMKS